MTTVLVEGIVEGTLFGPGVVRVGREVINFRVLLRPAHGQPPSSWASPAAIVA